MKTKAITGIMLTFFLMGVLSMPVMAKSAQAMLNGELLEARKHILKEERYQHVENALADGYVPVSPHVPQMGVHYANFPLTEDGVFNLLEPEILLYSGYTGELVGVEYVVPVFEPEGFTGDSDVWGFHEATCHYEDGSEIPESDPTACPPTNPATGSPFFLWHPDLNTLHVWLFEENPDGIFAELNPNVP